MNKYEIAFDKVVKIAKEIKHTFANYEYETNKEIVEEACKKAEAFDILNKYLFTKQNNGPLLSIWRRDHLYELQVLVDNKIQLCFINEKEFEVLKEVFNDNRSNN